MMELHCKYLCHTGVHVTVRVPMHLCVITNKSILGRRRSAISLAGGQAGATWGQGCPLLNVDRVHQQSARRHP